ncbi:DUF1572 domain-containing protein [Taibaiella sp. KBW10]|uniref:DUF1572 domain-containing protein n=1 Tax=Taibaiella sp. KBW10 TaxID=2153357 RepID=UPI000F5B3F9C|nr:DUF1572 domain-containing protein [Taibaiella sp. KBW10]RQO30942.1 DUF1572 domain-containing protein [Taibaiella sp. KBW10]
MNTSTQLAKHFRDIHFGGNWSWSNLKDNLSDVSWQQALTKVYGLNSICALSYHVHYYVAALIDVLEGRPLTAKDQYSFAHPPINSQEDWDLLLQTIWADAEKVVPLIEQLPEAQLWADFTEEKYGNYFRNLLGIIEHTHYHLGQIAIIKKIVVQMDGNT